MNTAINGAHLTDLSPRYTRVLELLETPLTSNTFNLVSVPALGNLTAVTVLSERFGIPISKMADGSDIEKLHQRLRKMSDSELLRFGVVCKYMCSLETNLDHRSREYFIPQLKEAQEEWKRRYPKLPLSASF